MRKEAMLLPFLLDCSLEQYAEVKWIQAPRYLVSVQSRCLRMQLECSVSVLFWPLVLTYSCLANDSHMSPFHTWQLLKFTTIHTQPYPSKTTAGTSIKETSASHNPFLSSFQLHQKEGQALRAQEEEICIKSENLSALCQPSETTVQLCVPHAWGFLHSNLE